MLQTILTKVFGTKSDRDTKGLIPIVDEINTIYETLQTKSNDDLINRTGELKLEVSSACEVAQKYAKEKISDNEEADKYVLNAEHEKLDEILPEAFAMVKEACRRTLGKSWRIMGMEIAWEMIPYDVQILGGIVLHSGKVTEMKTGEGKTLVATMPLYLNALSGRGAHLVTVNDYLAQRDAEWMGEIYKCLGLSVGFILNTMDNKERQAAYNCDITYGTNNEYGFDYLRDNMALAPEDQVQRDHAFVIVDEVDSVLIDEARTPLIISGSVDAPVDTTYKELKPMVQNLIKKQNNLVTRMVADATHFIDQENNDEAGLKLLQANRGMPKHPKLLKIFQEKGTKKLAHDVESEYMRDKKIHEVDEDLYFSIDEKTHVIDITEKGRQSLAPDDPDMFVIPDLGETLHEIDVKENLSTLEIKQEKEKAHQQHAEQSARIHNISQLLRAYTLYEKDVEYVVQGGKVQIVDEFTGRILAGRRYSDGLHQSLEAKENVTIERETQTLATITIQNYFRMYDKLAGMTGTAETEAEELGSIYDLDVVVIPTHRSIVRDDRDDLIFKTKREKYTAVIEEIAECYKNGQPTLVGTVSVDSSELLSRMLKRSGIPHNVLNAKQHKSEAEIVARAGQKGAVTIATNMAGRGTDIKLGEGIKELGGLHIVGTERHESRRIDLQLRGRSGRQGDSGSSRFYMSLEDDLMRLFNSEKVASIMDRMGIEEGEVITHKMVTRAIQNAQKKVEGRNFGIRKHLLEYDDVMNQQRQVVYDIRNNALQGENLRDTIPDLISDFVEDELDGQDEENHELWDWEGLEQNFSSVLLTEIDREKFDIELDSEHFKKNIVDEAMDLYSARESLLPEDVMRGFERFVVLRTIDEKWKDHLYAMDQLREGINLRAYGQKNPLLEYKSEGFYMFKEMMAGTTQMTLQRLFRTKIQGMDHAPQIRSSQARDVQLRHQDSTGLGFTGPPEANQNKNQPQQATMKPITADKKIGRNEKIEVLSPSGKRETVKYKKLQDYLNRGYTQT
jgi:preprotein translocase subunit SecA